MPVVPVTDPPAARVHPTWADGRVDLACRQPDADPDLWYPPPGVVPPDHPARLACGLCPAWEQCLRWAIHTGQAWGVWGGLTARERYTIRRRLEDR